MSTTGGPPQPPPLPPTVLGYRGGPLPPNTGRTYTGPVPAWRDGMQLVTPLSIILPHTCIKCNQPAGHRWGRTLYWQNPAWLFTLLIGVWVGALVILAVRKKAYIEVSLCDVHKRQNRRRILIGWGSAGVALLLLILSFFLFGSQMQLQKTLGAYVISLSGLTFLFAIFWGIIATPVVSLRRIKDGFAWYSRVGPEFLDPLSGF